MLTRFIKNQLIIFAIASIIGVVVMVFTYLQAPTLLGIGKYSVKLELPAAGGLYRFSNVTYRGVQMGKVTAVELTPTGAVATLSLRTSPKIPADTRAAVRSVSAVGEQYVNLEPGNDAPPYLRDGSVIPVANTTIPQRVGPMLDQVSALFDSIPKDKLGALLDESFKAFNGTGEDQASLLDSTATIARDANNNVDRTNALINDLGPVLDAQAQTADATRQWARSLAGVTEQLSINDPQFRAILRNGPGAIDEVSRLLNQVKPTLPVLLANLTTVGRVAVTYNASLEQLLVILPPYIASQQAYGGGPTNATGLPLGEFALTVSDPPACTVGFLPPSSWRNPADLTDIDTPDGLYCKLPQDSPIAVRGARNYPCMAHPGKRAPTVDICDSDKPFVPLAMRQHALGPYPLDPNLLSQGITPDDRTTFEDQIYGPLDGTPQPPVNQPANPDAGAPEVAPSGFTGNGSSGPSVAIVPYDPRTGSYVAPDGQKFQQADLVSPSRDRSWQDMLPT